MGEELGFWTEFGYVMGDFFVGLEFVSVASRKLGKSRYSTYYIGTYVERMLNNPALVLQFHVHNRIKITYSPFTEQME